MLKIAASGSRNNIALKPKVLLNKFSRRSISLRDWNPEGTELPYYWFWSLLFYYLNLYSFI